MCLSDGAILILFKTVGTRASQQPDSRKTYSEVSPTVSSGGYSQARLHRIAAFIVEQALEHVE